MRIVILTFESPQGNLITQHLLQRRSANVCGIVQATTIEPLRPGWQGTLRIVRRTAPRFLVWKVAEQTVSRLAWQWVRATGRRPAIPTLADLAAEAQVPLVTTRDINGDAGLAVLREWRPDLGLSVHFTQRLGKAALTVPPLGMLNVHGALLPLNRGLFPYFWELANGDAAAGVTVHWIDEQLDTGDIVMQRRVVIAPDETVSSLSWKGAALGATLLDEVLDRVVAGEATCERQPVAEASYFSWPARDDLRRLRARDRRLGSLADAWRHIVRAPIAARE